MLSSKLNQLTKLLMKSQLALLMNSQLNHLLKRLLGSKLERMSKLLS